MVDDSKCGEMEIQERTLNKRTWGIRGKSVGMISEIYIRKMVE